MAFSPLLPKTCLRRIIVTTSLHWHDGPETSGWGYMIAECPDGTAAIAEGTYGKGSAIMSGLHPEAPQAGEPAAPLRHRLRPTSPTPIPR